MHVNVNLGVFFLYIYYYTIHHFLLKLVQDPRKHLKCQEICLKRLYKHISQMGNNDSGQPAHAHGLLRANILLLSQ